MQAGCREKGQVVRFRMGGTAVGPLRILLAGSVAVPVALFVVVSWLNHGAAFAEAERDAIRTAEVAREHAASVFDSQKLVAERVDDALDGMDDAAIGRDEPALRSLFRRMIAGLPQVQSLIVLDRTGHALVATGAEPVDRTIDYADRDYFAALKDGHAPIFLSKVQVSRVDGQLFFGLGRRRETPGGAFAGVIDIAVSPSLFQTFWQALVGEEGGDDAGRVVTLVKADGQILARYPPFEGLPPKVVAPSPFFEALRAQSAERHLRQPLHHRHGPAGAALRLQEGPGLSHLRRRRPAPPTRSWRGGVARWRPICCSACRQRSRCSSSP